MDVDVVDVAALALGLGFAVGLFFGYREGYRNGVIIGKLKGVSEFLRGMAKNDGR